MDVSERQTVDVKVGNFDPELFVELYNQSFLSSGTAWHDVSEVSPGGLDPG